VKPVGLDFDQNAASAILNMDYDFFYDMIRAEERDMRGVQIEKPPWAEGVDISESIGGVVNGIRMWIMVQSAITTGKITSQPPESLYDVLNIMRFAMGPPGGQ
jgi:hypothetical protein